MLAAAREACGGAEGPAAMQGGRRAGLGQGLDVRTEERLPVILVPPLTGVALEAKLDK